jgi:hypothetical protein
MMLPMFLRNTWYTGYLPFNENLPYDRFGQPYNISAVVDERANFVESKYQAYSVYPTPPPKASFRPPKFTFAAPKLLCLYGEE